MVSDKHIELVVEQLLPKALIVGGGNLSILLSETLEKRGCMVENVSSYSPTLDTYEYIFQFGNRSLIDKLEKNHMRPSGKYLFIELDDEEMDKAIDGIKILRAGEAQLWDVTELIEKILRTLYSKRETSVVDVRKKAPPPQILSTNISRTEKSFSSDKSKKVHIHPIVVHQIHFVTHGKLIIFFTLFFIITAICSGLFYWYLFTVQSTIGKFRSHIASSNWRLVRDDMAQAKAQLEMGRTVFGIIAQIAFPLADTTLFKDVETLISVSDQLLITSDDLIAITDTFQKKSLGAATTTDGLTASEINQYQQNLLRLATTVTSSKKEIEKIKFSFFPKESFLSFLSSTEEKLKAAYDLMPLVEKLFLTDQPKVYLVLLQNNMELRPTGGFIGSYGLITIGKGKVGDFKIEDVYTADGQLKGHVDPPSPIRKYLNQPHFFLRDSNFDPDFAASAVRSAWFLQKEMGNTVDGVIGVNLFFVQKLLRAVGSVRIADFNNEEVTADNFFLKAQYYSQNNFFPGSTQKKDFLNAVTKVLMNKITIDKNSSLVQLFPIIRQSLDEKNVTFFFLDELSQKLMEQKGWGGRIVEVKCAINQLIENQITNDQQCFADYIAVSEANLGVNKANYFVNKSVAVEKKIDDNGKVVSTVTLSYVNANTPEIFGSTTYTNYIRLLVPGGSTLSQITLNLVPLSPADIDIETYGNDKTSFGFLVRIAPENKGIVKVSYTLPRSLSIPNESYQLLYQKQPGDKVAPFVLSVQSTGKISFAPVNFIASSQKASEVYYITDTSVDRIFAIDTASK